MTAWEMTLRCPQCSSVTCVLDLAQLWGWRRSGARRDVALSLGTRCQARPEVIVWMYPLGWTLAVLKWQTGRLPAKNATAQIVDRHAVRGREMGENVSRQARAPCADRAIEHRRPPLKGRGISAQEALAIARRINLDGARKVTDCEFVGSTHIKEQRSLAWRYRGQSLRRDLRHRKAKSEHALHRAERVTPSRRRDKQQEGRCEEQPRGSQEHRRCD